MHTELCPDAAAVAARAAEHIAAAAARALAEGGRFTLAVSGGTTPAAMFAAMAKSPLDWPRVHVFQVDERLAPAGHAARNWVGLRRHLAVPAVFHPMPVEGDVDAGAAAYAALLAELAPSGLDLVHLGLGADGHTASLVPGDPVCAADTDVALSGEYQGFRRMTVTYPVLDRARAVLWVVAGADKREAVRRLLARDPGIPGGRVRADRATLVVDAAAA